MRGGSQWTSVRTRSWKPCGLRKRTRWCAPSGKLSTTSPASPGVGSWPYLKNWPTRLRSAPLRRWRTVSPIGTHAQSVGSLFRQTPGTGSVGCIAPIEAGAAEQPPSTERTAGTTTSRGLGWLPPVGVTPDGQVTLRPGVYAGDGTDPHAFQLWWWSRRPRTGPFTCVHGRSVA